MASELHYRRSSQVMNQGEVYELNETSKGMDVKVSEEDFDAKASASVPGTVESQVRVRKLFNTAQLFMFSLTSMGLWEGMCT